MQFSKKSDCGWKRNPMLIHGKRGERARAHASLKSKRGGGNLGGGRKRRKRDLSSFLFFLLSVPSTLFLSPPLLLPLLFLLLFPLLTETKLRLLRSRVTRKTLVPAYQEARKATTDRSTLKKNRKKWNFSGSRMYRVSCKVY